MSARMIRCKICRLKLHRRSRKEIRISAQVWFQAVNGLCLAEFEQWPSGQMGDKFSVIISVAKACRSPYRGPMNYRGCKRL